MNLREECILRAFHHRVLRRKLGYKKKEIENDNGDSCTMKSFITHTENYYGDKM
jgi:hypothetical protein